MRGGDSFLVAGVCIEVWLDAFECCHANGYECIVRFCWPDGGAYLDQDNIVVSMFNLIKEEHRKIQNGK